MSAVRASSSRGGVAVDQVSRSARAESGSGAGCSGVCAVVDRPWVATADSRPTGVRSARSTALGAEAGASVGIGSAGGRSLPRRSRCISRDASTGEGGKVEQHDVPIVSEPESIETERWHGPVPRRGRQLGGEIQQPDFHRGPRRRRGPSRVSNGPPSGASKASQFWLADLPPVSQCSRPTLETSRRAALIAGVCGRQRVNPHLPAKHRIEADEKTATARVAGVGDNGEGSVAEACWYRDRSRQRRCRVRRRSHSSHTGGSRDDARAARKVVKSRPAIVAARAQKECRDEHQRDDGTGGLAQVDRSKGAVDSRGPGRR